MWDHDTPSDNPFAAILQPSFIASAADETYGSGLGAFRDITLLKMAGVDQPDLSSAITDNDFVQYSITTHFGINGLYISRLSQNKHGDATVAIPDNYGYSYAVLVSDDNFVSSSVLQDVVRVDNNINPSWYTDAFKVDDNFYYLEPNTTYTFRVYFFNKTTLSGVEAWFDDFQILAEICDQRLDVDTDDVVNSFDLDSDNDGIYDLYEAGHSSADSNNDGQLDGAPAAFGINGYLDAFESTIDNGTPNFSFADSETIPDGILDVYEIDADADGCLDAAEEGVSDLDADGIAGNGPPTVNVFGLVNGISYTAPPNDIWQNPIVGNCLSEICNDGIDNDGDGLMDCADCEDCSTSLSCLDTDGDGLGDTCDIDDDNDGIPDIQESGMTTSCPTIGSIDFPAYDYTNCSSISGGTLFSAIGTFEGVSIDMVLNDIGGATVDCASTGELGCVTGDNGFTVHNTDPDSIMIVSFFESGTSNPININWSIFLDDFDDVEGIAVDQNNLWSYVLNDNNNTTITSLGSELDFDSGDNTKDEISFFFVNVQTVSFRFTHDVMNRDACFSSGLGLVPDNPSCYQYQIVGVDSDGDGIDNHLDLDSDNDGIFDLDESGHSAPDANIDGIIDGAASTFGINGLFNGVETSPDSDTINYSVADSESSADGTYDAYELDSDGDGCFDTEEQSIIDVDNDGIAGTGFPTIDTAGRVSGITYSTPVNNDWQNPLITDCLIEDCSNGLDDDGDGLIDCDDPDCGVTTIGFENYQKAFAAAGQANLTTYTSGLSASEFSGVTDVLIDPVSKKVFVSEGNNNRVLRFASFDDLLNNQDAEAVLGQPNFITNTSGILATQMDNPSALTISVNGDLFVAEYSNNRVTKFSNAATIPTGSAADIVLGQPDFLTTSNARTQSKMYRPGGLFIEDDNTLWVGDAWNDRVLRFDNATSKSTGAPADGVLGQVNFTTRVNTVNAIYTNGVTGVTVVAGSLYATDYQNDRVLVWDNAKSLSNGSPAARVIGQPNFTSTTAPVSRYVVAKVNDISADKHNTLYVTDILPDRLTIYHNVDRLASFPPADKVLFQPDFTSTGTVSGAYGLGNATSAQFTKQGYVNYMFIGDRVNHRVLIFRPLIETDEVTIISDTLPGRDLSLANNPTFTIISQPGQGSVSLDDVNTGAYTYTPPGVCPVDTDTTYTFLYSISNANGCIDTAEMLIIVDDVAPCVEICGNGNDDDGNGLEDCLDPACEPVFVSVAKTDPTTCSGSDGTVTITATNTNDSTIYILDGVSQDTNYFTGLSAGLYTIEITNTWGCSNGGGNTVLLQDPSDPIVGHNLPDTLCIAESFNITATDAGPGAAYIWDLGTDANPQTPTGIGPHNISYSSSGMKYVSLRVNKDGCTAILTDSVLVMPEPSFTFTPTNLEVCVGSSNSVFYGPAGMVSYSWSLVSGNSSIVGSNTRDSVIINIGTIDFDLNLDIVDSYGCTSSDQQAISVHSLPTVTLNLITDTVCTTDNNVALSGDSPSGGIYSGPGVSTGIFDATSVGTGTYGITYTYTDMNGCTNSAVDSISVFPPPSITSVDVTDPDDCDTANGIIEINATGSAGALEYRINSGTWQSSNIFTGLADGNYTADVRNANGSCIVAYGSNINLMVPAAPTANINVPANICLGAGSVTFSAQNAGGGAVYDWDFGSGASPATGSGRNPSAVTYSTAGAKTIQLSVTRKGCITSTSAGYTVYALPNVTLNFGTDLYCLDDATVTLNDGSPSGGTYSGPGVSTGNFNPSVAGAGTHTITYTFTDSNGCTDSATDQIEVDPIPNITNITHSDEICNGDNGTITFSFTNQTGYTNIEFSIDGGANYDYSTLDDAGTFTINNLIPGNYDLWARWGDDSCPVDETDVTIDPEPIPAITEIFTTDPYNCPTLTNGTILIVASGTNLSFSIDSGLIYQPSPSFTDLIAGTYNVAVRDTVTGCIAFSVTNPLQQPNQPCEEICFNQIDDDGDGDIDENDSDCDNSCNETVILIAQEGGRISQKNINTGFQNTVTFSPYTTGNLNALAANPDGGVLYYGRGRTVYYWEPTTDTHGVLMDLSASVSAQYSLTSGGGAYYNNYIYMGFEDDVTSADPFVVRIPVSSNGYIPTGDIEFLSVPLASNLSWGDMIVSREDGDVYIYFTNGIIGGGGNSRYSKYNTRTGAYSVINSGMIANLQVGVDINGELWGASVYGGQIQRFDKNTGSFYGAPVSISGEIWDLTGPMNCAQRPEDCSNGIDDDEDGLVDCNDSDCKGDGNADIVFASSGVNQKDEALGAPDDSPAELYNNGDWIILDLIDLLQLGQQYHLTMRKASAGNPSVLIEESSDAITWNTANGFPISVTNSVYETTSITSNTAVRYLRITNQSNESLDFDAVGYSLRCSTYCPTATVNPNVMYYRAKR